MGYTQYRSTRPQCIDVRLCPLTAAPVGDSRGSYWGQSGHPNLTTPRQLMTQTGNGAAHLLMLGLSSVQYLNSDYQLIS